MSFSNSVTLDFSQPEINQRILPCSPILSSQTLGWQNLYMQRHRQPAWETPECSHHQHTIIVHPVAPQSRLERRLDGQRRSEQIHRGDIVFAPANVHHQVTWNQTIDYTLLVLEPSYVAQIVYEDVNPERVELFPRFAMSDLLIYQIEQVLRTELEAREQSDRLYVEAATMMLAVHLLKYYCVRDQPLQDRRGL